MNTPNKLTILRVVLIPVFIIFMLYEITPFARFIALGIFVLAFFTDFLDGYLARKNEQVTNFGKIIDPLADKMLVMAALVCLNVLDVVSPWVTIVILAREFMVSGIRIAAASEGMVIAASKWGKVKTIWQFVAICVALLLGSSLITDIGMLIAVALTMISGVDYIMKNSKHLTMD